MVTNSSWSLSVLALVAVANHQLVTRARAADLNPGQVGAFTCNGIGTWHFVNNQVGAVLPPATLIAIFSCGTETATAFKVNPNGNQQFVVETSGICRLVAASTIDSTTGLPFPGKLVLSDVVCAAATPTATSTATP